MFISDSGALELMCELEGGKPKYALLCANAIIMNGQKKIVVLGKERNMLFDWTTGIAWAAKAVGGLKDIIP